MAVFIILARVDHLDQSICRFGRGLMGFCVQTEQEYVRGRPWPEWAWPWRQLFDVAAYRLYRIQDTRSCSVSSSIAFKHPGDRKDSWKIVENNGKSGIFMDFPSCLPDLRL
jgi:hypothetical protein